MPTLANISTSGPADELTPAAYLETPLREFMTAGVITIAEDASLAQVYRAMRAHATHSVLVVGRRGGRPLGWVNAHGLLAWIGRDETVLAAREAITERPVSLPPSASADEARRLLSQPATSHVLVSLSDDGFPEGVVSDLDLVALAAR